MYQLYFLPYTYLTLHSLKEFGYVGQLAAAGPGLAHFDEWPRQVPGPGEPATEILHRFANRYLNHPNSQVDTVCMEPRPAGGIRMVITLEVADLL